MVRGEEKREYVRVILDIPFKFSLPGYPAEKSEGRITDLSIGGMAIETSAEINVGENLTMDIALPNGLSCSLSGQVLREIGDSNKYGIKLVQVSISDRIKLGDFIMNQLEEQNYVIKKFMKRKDAEN